MTKATVEEWLKGRLQEREEQGLLRRLSLPPEQKADFSSNDYLGLSHTGAIHAALEQVGGGQARLPSSATGSRLISGNYREIECLEQELAAFHHAEAALVFNSGYNANVGLLSCLATRGDTYLSDALSHASLIDGMRLSYAQRLRFKHNDLQDLEQKLKSAKGRKFIVTEAVFSMDGDQAPLSGILHLAQQYDAHLIVDEAHSIGVFGNQGEGLCQELGIEDRVFARIYTFGKAPACHGAAIVGSEALKKLLINFSRAFIYTTALPPHAIRTIQASYLAMVAANTARQRLYALIHYLREKASSHEEIYLLDSQSAIQSLLVPGNEAVVEVAEKLQAAGIWAKPIRYPTVPQGEERIRLCLHSFNTEEEIDRVIDCLRK